MFPTGLKDNFSMLLYMADTIADIQPFQTNVPGESVSTRGYISPADNLTETWVTDYVRAMFQPILEETD